MAVYPYMAIVICSYVIGSIPTSYIAGKLLFSLDLREHGSGNVGATNALRVLGMKTGILVLIGDMGKGVCAVLLSGFILRSFNLPLSSIWLVVGGGFAIIGHIYTFWLKFKGGKGVATSAGVFMALTPWSLISALVVFGITVGVTRYVSLGSILGALSITPFICIETGKCIHPYSILAVLAASFIVFKHRANIGRLRDGSESKIGASSGSPCENTDHCEDTSPIENTATGEETNPSENTDPCEKTNPCKNTELTEEIK